ncbi:MULTISPECIES: sigma-70 family RNA polymerase sigma factor [Rubritalea]|nr:sigma-70 family RNA polymerase sigma factor [Rubritalea squalenifaciens]
MNPHAMQEFVTLLTNHQEVIRSYILSQAPNCPDVRDLQQEVNILLWKRMEDFELGTNFGAWACTIAYYKILDYRKHLKKDGFLVFNNELSDLLATESSKRQPAQLDARRAALTHCINNLPAHSRELIETHYRGEEQDIESIAQETGRPVASLRVSLCRIRARLKDCITKRLILEGGAS